MRKVHRSSVVTRTARLVVRQGRVWLRDPEGRREEGGAASLAVFIMFLPLILGVFGFGIDHAKNIWIRTSIQNAVDSSAVAGAAVTSVTASGQLEVAATPLVAAEMRKLYALNRADNPGLRCLNPGHVYCWREPFPPAVGKDTLGRRRTTQFDVQEQSTNAFLGFLGTPIQTYNLRGKAKVSLSTE